MKHCYFRVVLGVIWLIAAVVSGLGGNLFMVTMYGVLALIFLSNAYTIWKKEKVNRG